MKRCVLIFPYFNNIGILTDIRRKYDPLANFMNPHITIVFPFESDISTEDLYDHFNDVLKKIEGFNILLNNFTGDKDGYIFLNVKKGNDEIINLHDKLYSGILAKYLYNKLTYFPHLTIGKLQSQNDIDIEIEELQNKNDVFEAVIDKIYVVNIDSNDNSIIEFTYNLQN